MWARFGRTLTVQIGAWWEHLLPALLVHLVTELGSLIVQLDPGVRFWLVTSFLHWS